MDIRRTAATMETYAGGGGIDAVLRRNLLERSFSRKTQLRLDTLFYPCQI